MDHLLLKIAMHCTYVRLCVDGCMHACAAVANASYRIATDLQRRCRGMCPT